MKQISPITADFRKAGYQDLYDYVQLYADQHCNGKLASALIEMVKDHKSSKMDRAGIFMVQGNHVIAKL